MFPFVIIISNTGIPPTSCPGDFPSVSTILVFRLFIYFVAEAHVMGSKAAS